MSADVGDRSRSRIRFVFDGKIREHETVDTTITVLDYLRTIAGKKATKEGCAEGDCGACTVAVGELVDGRMHYRAVNSCIQFLPMLDSRHLITLEDLARDGELHPIQEAMIARDGSQCGFCTPGFVMSMYVLSKEKPVPTICEIEDALAGNLCRCTGYGPIIEAARDRCKAAHERNLATARTEDMDQLRALQADERPLFVKAGDRSFQAPRSTEQLIACLKENPMATIVAGATDIGLWVTKRHMRLQHIISVGEVRELKQIVEETDRLVIGAAATYDELHAPLEAHHKDLGELVRRIGSQQVRNQATIGGNIANGSPIGDGPPALIALGAILVLNGIEGRRELPLEDFFVAYGKQDRSPGEFVEAVILPKLRPNQKFAAYKISKRFDQDISAVCGAFAVSIANGLVDDIRICFGGMAATPKRASACEAAIVGQPWSELTIEKAVVKLAADYAPMTDMRASSSYRSRVAANLLRKFLVETTQVDAGTRIIETVRSRDHA
ncbi:xanthine dehydrogenase small subunit [Mesorhizobium sp. PAMC28654]|uniref:xanthine dehydrogenase small subunit n=1 Tax=Mesorhizobium sp. PAMC28654 TaxID=2880934 RepID=UPI001D0B480A|nr:xanthine dehydrogenase small subunit [Mesorhizobium sp. PAMC28654]UDL91712.1 xanthine dehydrogenase small subunit [Mesorhizobium sp. PAMC28654]